MKKLRKVKVKIYANKIIEVRIDPALNKYNNITLFPEKLAKAKEDIKNSNLLEVIEQFEKERKS